MPELDERRLDRTFSILRHITARLVVAKLGLDNACLPTSEPEKGIGSAEQTQSVESERRGYIEDVQVIQDIFKELSLLPEIPDIPAADEFTKDILAFRACTSIAFQLISTATCLLDIRHQLQSHPTSGADALKDIGKRALNSLLDHLKFSKPMAKPDAPAWASQAHREIADFTRDLVKWVHDDTFKHHDSLNPLFPGTLSTWCVLGHHCLGLKIANSWSSVITVANLYNCLLANHCIESTWPDMEFIIRINSPEHLFYGARPSSMADCSKRFKLALLGFTAEDFSQNRRQRNIVRSTKQIRALKGASPLWDALRDKRLRRTSTDLAGTWEHLVRKSLEHLRKSGSTLGEKRLSDCSTDISLLVVVRQCLSEEIPHLLFDYFSMHKRCTQFLREANEAIQKDLQDHYGIAYIAYEDKYMPMFVDMILELAAVESRRKPHQTPEVLVKIGKIMQAVIEDEGKTEMDRVWQSSGGTFK